MNKTTFSLEAPLRILLADDDKDDRFFFHKALRKLDFPFEVDYAEDGEQLMSYLSKKIANQLPYVLFLDLNMPRKNGSECLLEIKQNKELTSMPVIIYSTSLHRDTADFLYKNGAHYYIKKCDFDQLLLIIKTVLALLLENKVQPTRDNFVLNVPKA